MNNTKAVFKSLLQYEGRDEKIGRIENAHIGLYLNRFWPTAIHEELGNDREKAAFTKFKNEITKAQWEKINGFQLKFSQTLINQTVDRVCSFNGQVESYACRGRFLTGSGLPHPSENGFLWHPTLGLPYLPGSAVKGITRAAIERYYEGDDKESLLLRWFGSETKDANSFSSGNFIFYDALPLKSPKLAIEIMTPHMSDWYAKGDEATSSKRQPGDWHTPIPISYLTANNIELLFAIQPRHPKYSDELHLVFEALDHALAYIGAGAKTAIGFGQFTRIDTPHSIRQRFDADIEAAIEKNRKSGMSQGAQDVDDLIKKLNALGPIQRRWSSIGPLLNEIRALIEKLNTAEDRNAKALLKTEVQARLKSDHPNALEIPKGKKNLFNWD
jgi:CRISPR-associated protein Cmr6